MNKAGEGEGRRRSSSWPNQCRGLQGSGHSDGVHAILDHKLRIDKKAVNDDARFDGKWLIRTSDHRLTPTDLAKAYKQLYQVERGWRDLKGALQLRPSSATARTGSDPTYSSAGSRCC